MIKVKKQILDCFYNYVVDNISEDSGNLYISDEIDDPEVSSFIDHMGYYTDEFYNLDDVINDIKKVSPKGYTCDTELLFRYDAGIYEGTGGEVLFYKFGNKGFIQSFLNASFSRFLYCQDKVEIKKSKSGLIENITDFIQWEDAPHIQINSVIVNDKYIDINQLKTKIISNLSHSYDDILIKLHFFTEKIDRSSFFQRLTESEKYEVLKIDSNSYRWDLYDAEQLKSAFFKGIIHQSCISVLNNIN